MQSSVAPRANQNLAFNFFGPYTILQRNGRLAHKWVHGGSGEGDMVTLGSISGDLG
jgi:hypothetical protein